MRRRTTLGEDSDVASCDEPGGASPPRSARTSEPLVPERPPRDPEPAVVAKWARLLRKYFGIKRQQWIFHSTGSALKLVSKQARDRLSETYKIEKIKP